MFSVAHVSWTTGKRMPAEIAAWPGCTTGSGAEMRLIVVLGAIGALSQAAAAQTSECRAIADPAARLTCYDKPAAAPAANSPTPTPPPAIRPESSAAASSKHDQRARQERT